MDDSKVKSDGDTPPGDLMSQVEQRIKNPLADLTPAQVLQDVEHFANEHGLRDILDHLKKGALIARDPDNFETVENMTDDDITVIARETTHKWRQPWPLYFTIGLCSIGAAVQGWDQTGSNGANLSFPDALGIPEKGALKARNQWLVGILNSAPYLATAFGGCWISDPLNKYLGRRGVIFISAIFCLLTPIGSAVAQTWPQLFVTRLLMGIGMGLKGATIPIYCAENTPANIRGGLVMSWQLWTAFGIFLGTSANLAVKDTGAISWRLQLGSAFIPALPLTLGVFLCPESPRWYLKKGQVRKAYQSLCKLRNSNLQAARDLYYIYTQIKIEEELVGKHNFLVRLGELFTIPRVRRATLASWTVMLAQQMCGINIVAFYSSTIFAQAGANVTEALLASWGFGLINFLFAFPAVFTIDTYGRRALLLFTFPQMAWTLLAAGFSFYIPQEQTAHLACISLFVFMFAAFYSVGEGPVPFAYSAEVFPLSHREVGMSFAVATNLFWAAVLGITFPRMLAVMSPTGAFAFYAGLNVTACIMIFFLVPETKQRTLEELDYVFAVPVRMHSGYQLKKALPYWVKRYIFRRNVKLDPLYQFDHVATHT
ncbi:putative transporter [Aspergillus oryzae 100-8]|uniref:Putative transporter n=1 Tax=Aspergillus oryzae (strain 3.042) TaxID=1160506 RepID=I7ZWI9_ASPO3|nr:putative transporter [Aspergillus oryzae 3.042]KDE80343.1 putative transporter [Aspergillus oryzae 100-8]|eukprot:EIT76529.1 putative transporter [Aspergillus oryzae 3.042]